MTGESFRGSGVFKGFGVRSESIIESCVAFGSMYMFSEPFIEKNEPADEEDGEDECRA